MLDQAKVDFAEIRANRKKRSLLVARHAHDYDIQAPQRITQRKLQLLESGGMFFGIHARGAERLVARFNFVAIMFENVERLRKLFLRDVRRQFPRIQRRRVGASTWPY